MLRIAVSILMTLIVVGCGPRYVDYFPYYDDGTPKPKVALMPIIDSSNSQFPWDISEEISQGIYYELMNSGEFYVLAPQEIGPAWAKRDQIDFFDTDMSFVSDFRNTDFIVAMELIEHSTTPCDPCMAAVRQHPSCYPLNRVMTMRVRIKIIDVRCETPKIVLYEVLKSCYTGMTQSETTQLCWGEPGYYRTSCGIAHQRLVSKLTRRLEEVIWSVK